jgi:glycosyltransferase involved in cell wall biosynthesis
VHCGGRSLLIRYKANQGFPALKMKILFVHEVGWFSKVVYEMHDFPELLSLRGHEVHFLEFDENYSRTHWKSVVSVESRSHAGSKVGVITPPHLFTGILCRLAATVIQPIVFIRLLKKIRPDVVVTYSIPTSGWQAVAICRKRRIPIVVRAIDVSHKLRQTRFEKAILRAEQFVYKHADHVCTNNEALLDYCITMGASINKSSVIHPGVDLNRFFPAPPSSNLQHSLGIAPSDKVLLFMGTIFRFSGLVELLTELAPALHNDPTLKFLILGDGEDLGRVKATVGRFGLHKQVITTGQIEYNVLVDYLRLGHVALLPFEQGLVTHGALPGKVLQYLACGIPTIASPLKGLMSVLKNDNGVIYANTSILIATEAIDMARNPLVQQEFSIKGSKSMIEHFNWDRQIEIFENLLNSLTLN